ncbi:MAG: hypothetical protein V9E99_02065 [Microthrixaceae bacterium]
MTLPVDLEAIFDAGGASGASLSIATSGDVVVAAVAITPMLQLSTLLPSPESNQFWQRSADGSGVELWGTPLDVAEAAVVSCPDGWSAGATWVPAQPQGEFSTAVGPNGETIEMVRCPSPNGGEPLDVSPESVRLQSKTWNELGLDQPPVGSSRVFRSTDGSSFEEVSVPWATPASDSSMSIAGTSSGFTLIRSAFVPATPAPIIEAATSPDGSAWTLDTADAIPAFDWVRDLTILDDHPVTMGGRSDGTTTVLRREDTGAWTTIEPAKLLRGLASESETGVPVYYYSSVSESGIALLYGAGGEPPEESEDAGYRLQVDTSGNAVVSDRSGAEVGRLALVDGSAVEGALRYDAAKNTVQVLDTDGRTPLATLPVRAWQDTPRLRYLVWSPDGQRWGVEDLDAVTTATCRPMACRWRRAASPSPSTERPTTARRDGTRSAEAGVGRRLAPLTTAGQRVDPSASISAASARLWPFAPDPITPPVRALCTASSSASSNAEMSSRGPACSRRASAVRIGSNPFRTSANSWSRCSRAFVTSSLMGEA